MLGHQRIGVVVSRLQRSLRGYARSGGDGGRLRHEAAVRALAGGEIERKRSVAPLRAKTEPGVLGGIVPSEGGQPR